MDGGRGLWEVLVGEAWWTSSLVSYPEFIMGTTCTRARGRHILVAEVMLLTDWLVRERGGWGGGQ